MDIRIEWDDACEMVSTVPFMVSSAHSIIHLYVYSWTAIMDQIMRICEEQIHYSPCSLWILDSKESHALNKASRKQAYSYVTISVLWC